MKKYWYLIPLSLILSIAIVFGLPMLRKSNVIEANIENETSLVHQEILSYDQNEKTYNKIYN